MAHQPHPNSLHSSNHIAVKSSPPTSSSSLKIKTLIQAFILRHVCRAIQALTSAKTLIKDLLEKKKAATSTTMNAIKFRRREDRKLFDSFRTHYNWCSSYVTPEPYNVEAFDVVHEYYDSTWNSVITTEGGDEEDMAELSGYLNWLEEEGSEMDDGASEIDRLAEKFIAKCHEKFRLEKQESYRMYQEMLARSI